MKSAVRFLLILLGLLGPPSGAWAQPEEASPPGPLERTFSFLRDEGLSGSFRLDYFRSSKDLDRETDFPGGTAQIKMTPRLGDRLDGKVEARATEPDLFGDRLESDTTLLEGYLTIHFARADIRIGKQIVAWGRADGINPTDNLTPHDFVILLPFEEDQRFGTTAMKIDGYLPMDLTLTLFTTPFFEPSKIPLGSPTNGQITENRPDHTRSNSEVGLKLNHNGGRLDWSVSYFHGFDLLPDARMIGLSAAGPVIELRHNRINVVGADAARNFGRYGFRTEAAYFMTRDRDGQDPTVKNPFLFYVAGIDRTFLENLNLNLQFVGRWIKNFNNPESIVDPALKAVAIQNAIFDNQQDRTSYGLTSRIGDKWLNDTLEAEVLLFINFKRTNEYIRPLVTYAFTDHVKGTVGGEIYRGPEDSFFGRLKDNRGAFTELRYSF
jgi:hypothetical protein